MKIDELLRPRRKKKHVDVNTLAKRTHLDWICLTAICGIAETALTNGVDTTAAAAAIIKATKIHTNRIQMYITCMKSHLLKSDL